MVQLPGEQLGRPVGALPPHGAWGQRDDPLEFVAPLGTSRGSASRSTPTRNGIESAGKKALEHPQDDIVAAEPEGAIWRGESPTSLASQTI